MSQVKELLQQNELWNDLIATFHSGTVPGAVGIETRPIWQEEIMRIFASHILCENGTACGQCRSCRSWVDGAHPDLLIAGAPDAPAPVDECRRKSADLPMSPVIAPRRLLVFYGPEKMSPGAVNSLLKITEEPPDHGHILYLMSKANILSTLRSRLWMLSLLLEESFAPLEPPRGQKSWLRWLSENEKKDANDWYAAAYGYAAWLCRHGETEQAAQLQQLAETALTTHLSSAMWSDLLFLLLRGEYPFEHVFDDFRQAPLPGAGFSRRRNDL
ncbi:MAG: hypothetical protein J6E31_06205 [Pyramidobacter sp.]|nr:hypothetical protein [Pyramidobacter sp.]